MSDVTPEPPPPQATQEWRAAVARDALSRRTAQPEVPRSLTTQTYFLLLITIVVGVALGVLLALYILGLIAHATLNNFGTGG